MALIFAKRVERNGRYVYGEWCTLEDPVRRAQNQAEFSKVLEEAGTVVAWADVKGSNAVNFSDIFSKRHDFMVSVAAFGPFKSTSLVEQLRELYIRIKRVGRLQWQTHNGRCRTWYDADFYKLP